MEASCPMGLWRWTSRMQSIIRESRGRVCRVYREAGAGVCFTRTKTYYTLTYLPPLMYAAGSNPIRNSLLGAPGFDAALCKVSHQM